MGLTSYQHLEKRFKRIQILRSVIHLLRWDAEVMMPRGSSEVRAEQLSLLDTECSAILHSKKTLLLLDRVESRMDFFDDWQRANVREMRRICLCSNAIPKRLVNSLHRATTKAEMRWRQAVEEKNFKLLLPHLQKVVDLVREKANCLGNKLGYLPYDGLIQEYDPGRESQKIDSIFQVLDSTLPALTDEVIAYQSNHPPLGISKEVSIKKQKELGKFIMQRMGFPFHKGRLDESLHPFTEGTSEDIRITSKFAENDFLTGLMGVLHETGHAMYDFALPAEWFFQAVGRDRGMTVHESQALFLEMVIGRSREFMRFAAPCISHKFGVTGPEWEPENLLRLANRVRKSFIRMEADEVTYPLHILLRYNLEKDLFSGKLQVKDLPEAWNEAFSQRFGMTPENPNQGCLQDSHWPMGYFGYFPTYVLGGIMASQLYQSMVKDQPGILPQIEAGEFKPVFDWLDQKIYRFGAKLSCRELVVQATGEEINPETFLDYLRKKYLNP
jgi:carboxypeptidase Taq